MGGGEKPSGEYMMNTYHQFSLKASQPERLCNTNISTIMICASHGNSISESELDKGDSNANYQQADRLMTPVVSPSVRAVSSLTLVRAGLISPVIGRRRLVGPSLVSC